MLLEVQRGMQGSPACGGVPGTAASPSTLVQPAKSLPILAVDMLEVVVWRRQTANGRAEACCYFNPQQRRKACEWMARANSTLIGGDVQVAVANHVRCEVLALRSAVVHWASSTSR